MLNPYLAKLLHTRIPDVAPYERGQEPTLMSVVLKVELASGLRSVREAELSRKQSVQIAQQGACPSNSTYVPFSF